MANCLAAEMHVLFLLLPPKHSEVSDDSGQCLVTQTECLEVFGDTAPFVHKSVLPELEEETERVLLVNWKLPETLNFGVIWLPLLTPSFSLGKKIGVTQNAAGVLG